MVSRKLETSKRRRFRAQKEQRHKQKTDIMDSPEWEHVRQEEESDQESMFAKVFGNWWPKSSPAKPTLAPLTVLLIYAPAVNVSFVLDQLCRPMGFSNRLTTRVEGQTVET